MKEDLTFLYLTFLYLIRFIGLDIGGINGGTEFHINDLYPLFWF
jgi:hypothetical protein